MWWYYIFFFIKVMVSVIITSAITRYGFRYNFIKVFGVADIFRYPISITLSTFQNKIMSSKKIENEIR